MASFSLPSFKTKLPSHIPKIRQSEKNTMKSSYGATYYPYNTMNFRPNLTKSSKGFQSSKGFEKHTINYRTFEEYLVEGYGLLVNDEDLQILNKPAFELVKKDQRLKKLKDLGLKVTN